MESVINIGFVGDIILNNRYNDLWNKGINPFKQVEGYLSKFDYVIGNLESLAKGTDCKNPLRSTVLSTEVETLGFLKILNIDAVTLANNHVYDHKKNGFEITTNKLDELGVHWFGASTKKEELKKPFILKINDIRIGFLNYVSEDTNPNIPENADVFVNWLNKEQVICDIKDLKQEVHHIVLIPHWGGVTEYSMLPHHTQLDLAKDFVNAGADLIIGHHSHTAQPHQRINGKSVYYSLGNFCMDMDLYNYRSKRMSRGLLIESYFHVSIIRTNTKYVHNKERYISIPNRNIPVNIYNSKINNKYYLKIHNYIHMRYEGVINKITHNMKKVVAYSLRNIFK